MKLKINTSCRLMWLKHFGERQSFGFIREHVFYHWKTLIEMASSCALFFGGVESCFIFLFLKMTLRDWFPWSWSLMPISSVMHIIYNTDLFHMEIRTWSRYLFWIPERIWWSVVLNIHYCSKLWGQSDTISNK